jgi:hypothetical protein
MSMCLSMNLICEETKLSSVVWSSYHDRDGAAPTCLGIFLLLASCSRSAGLNKIVRHQAPRTLIFTYHSLEIMRRDFEEPLGFDLHHLAKQW